MIQLFKMFSGLDKLDGKFFILEVKNRIRGHSKKFRKQNCRLDLWKFFFSHRVVDYWNSLPGEIVDSSSLSIFKGRLDAYMDEEGLL